MEYRIRTAVPADEARIRELFLEMLRTVYNTNDVKGYEDGDLDRFWRKSSDRIYVAEDGQVVAFCPQRFTMIQWIISIWTTFQSQQLIGTKGSAPR